VGVILLITLGVILLLQSRLRKKSRNAAAALEAHKTAVVEGSEGSEDGEASEYRMVHPVRGTHEIPGSVPPEQELESPAPVATMRVRSVIELEGRGL